MERGTVPQLLAALTATSQVDVFDANCPFCIGSSVKKPPNQQVCDNSGRAPSLCSYHATRIALYCQLPVQDGGDAPQDVANALQPASSTVTHAKKLHHPHHLELPVHIAMTETFFRQQPVGHVNLAYPGVKPGSLPFRSTSMPAVYARTSALQAHAYASSSAITGGASSTVASSMTMSRPMLAPSSSTVTPTRPSLLPAKSRTLPVPGIAGDVVTAAARAGAVAATVSMARSLMQGDNTTEAAARASEASAVSSAATVSSVALSTLVTARAVESGMSLAGAQALGSFVGAGVGALLSSMYQAAGECLLSDREPGGKGKCVTSYVAQGASSAAAGWGACAAAAAISGPAAAVTCPVAAFIASWGAKSLARRAVPDR